MGVRVPQHENDAVQARQDSEIRLDGGVGVSWSDAKCGWGRAAVVHV